MEILFNDACLLINKADDENFDITELQTDNTFNIGIERFINKKEAEITKAKFKAKSQTILKISALRDFNDYHMTIKAESIIIVQKN